MKLLLDLATLLGGLSAAWFLWDKLREWNYRFNRRHSGGTFQSIQTPNTKMTAPSGPSTTMVGGWRVLMLLCLGGAAIAGGGVGCFLVADAARNDGLGGSWILLLGGSMVLGFWASKISERYVVTKAVQGTLFVISFAMMTAGMTGFVAYLIGGYIGLPAPQTAFFCGAGLVLACIVVLWISEVTDRGARPSLPSLPWRPPMPEQSRTNWRPPSGTPGSPGH